MSHKPKTKCNANKLYQIMIQPTDKEAQLDEAPIFSLRLRSFAYRLFRSPEVYLIKNGFLTLWGCCEADSDKNQ